jgi:hypothetical protein
MSRRPRRPAGDSGVVPAAPSEGSLAWLAGRRDRDGVPLIDAVEREAGERLAADWERVARGGTVTMDWDRLATRVGRQAGAEDARLGAAEAAMVARTRLECALASLEPDFAAVLVAVCCRNTGLSAVERRFGWPVRGGKVVLRYALRALARHYGLIGTGPERSERPRHRGADDVRPRT